MKNNFFNEKEFQQEINAWLKEAENIVFFEKIIEKAFEFYKSDCFHSKRVSKILFYWGKKRGESERVIKSLRLGGLLHDIGKVFVDENILMKKESLNYLEHEDIKLHTTKGYELFEFLTDKETELFKDMILLHHEKNNGKGYWGIKKTGTAVKMLTIVDAFDVMITGRHYSLRKTYEETKKEMYKNTPHQFENKLLEDFFDVIESEKKFFDIIKTTH